MTKGYLLRSLWVLHSPQLTAYSRITLHLFYTVIILLMLVIHVDRVHAEGDYRHLTEIDKKTATLDREIEHWVLRSELLIRRIDALIGSYEEQKKRDLDLEATQKAIHQIDEPIKRHYQMIARLKRECQETSSECDGLLSKHEQRLLKLKEHKKYLINTLKSKRQ